MAWPKAPRAVDRASIGREHSQALDKIGSLQYRIIVLRAETLADAAVQLRRLEAIVDTGAGSGWGGLTARLPRATPRRR